MIDDTTLCRLAGLSYRQAGTTDTQWARDLAETLAEVGATNPRPFLGSNRGEGFAVDVGVDRVYVFRGTEFDVANDPVKVVQDWVTNLRSSKLVGFAHQPDAKVGKGFADVAESMMPDVLTDVKAARDERRKLYFIGHSLGGALATILAASVVHSGSEVYRLITYGCPRVGDEAFAIDTAARLGLAGKIIRYVNGLDAVPRVPPAMWGFEHVGELRYFRTTNLRNATGDMVVNPSPAFVWLDQIYGRYLAWRQGIKAVAFHSHAMTQYLTLIKARS